jgi:hypothetical protein
MQVFVVAQRESVEAFFSQNGYITYDALRKLTVPQPKQYLQVDNQSCSSSSSTMLYDFAMDIVYALMARWISCLKRFYEQAKYVDGIALETVFVHSSIVSQLDAAAEEAIATNTW